MRKLLGSTTTRVVLFAGFALLATACLPTFGGNLHLVATSGPGSSARLIWNQAFDEDAADSIAYYELSVDGTVVDTVVAPATNCTMTGLASATTYALLGDGLQQPRQRHRVERQHRRYLRRARPALDELHHTGRQRGGRHQGVHERRHRHRRRSPPRLGRDQHRRVRQRGQHRHQPERGRYRRRRHEGRRRDPGHAQRPQPADAGGQADPQGPGHGVRLVRRQRRTGHLRRPQPPADARDHLEGVGGLRQLADDQPGRHHRRAPHRRLRPGRAVHRRQPRVRCRRQHQRDLRRHRSERAGVPGHQERQLRARTATGTSTTC